MYEQSRFFAENPEFLCLLRNKRNVECLENTDDEAGRRKILKDIFSEYMRAPSCAIDEAINHMTERLKSKR